MRNPRILPVAPTRSRWRKEGREPELKMDEETQKRSVLAVEPLKATTLKPELASYGRVIDPSPLVALDGELSAAETALEASQAAETRRKSLFQSGGNVAAKQLENSGSAISGGSDQSAGAPPPAGSRMGRDRSQLDAGGARRS